MTNPSWKFLPVPTWNKTFSKATNDFNVVLDFIRVRVQDAIKQIEDKGYSESDQDKSVLEKMITRNGKDSLIPLVTAIDLIAAGIDTTGNSLGHVLYHLSTNPESQEKLRQECQNLGSRLTIKDLDKMKYTKACIQESMRLTPTTSAMVRVLPNDIELRGHHIPSGTMMFWQHSIINYDERLFSNAEKYIPERWIENKRQIHPFAYRPFSHGPRMCIGKRFAELELQVALHNIISNFEIEWMNSQPLTIHQELINVRTYARYLQNLILSSK